MFFSCPRGFCSWIKGHWFPLVIFLAFSTLLISKALYLPGCFAFDQNDDRNHTFVNLFASREIMQKGEIPQINFYNNFGTPILGDALTYPFAPQALTYWFFSNPLAMTINRFVIAFLTLFLWYLFFRTYFRKSIATLLSLFVFATPGFLWHFAHHHYQMAQLMFVAALFVLRLRSLGKLSLRASFALLFVIGVLLVASTSINVVAIAIPFIVLASIFLGSERWKQLFSVALGAFFASLIITAPQTISFVKEIASSNRITSSYIEGTAYEKYNVFRVALGAVTQVKTGGGHIDVAVYFSVFALVAGFLGVWLLYKDSSSRRTGIMAGILGILPLLVVLALLSLPRAWAHIPFLKSTDITRVWWFSNAFFALGIGAFLERFMKRELSKRMVAIALLIVVLTLFIILAWRGLCGAGISVFGRCGPQNSVEPLYLWGMVFTLIAFFIYLFYGRVPLWGNIFIFLAFALAMIPNPIVALDLNEPACIGSHYFALKEHSTFEPGMVLAAMEPGYRLASEELSAEAHDLTAIFDHVLGSNGRSIIMDKQFTDYLLSKNLIAVDDRLSGYHFIPPWQPKELERLGIRYVFAAKTAPELENTGWRILAKDGKRVLYEDPLKPSPFYLLQNSTQEFLRNYRFTGNSAEIVLPEIKNPTMLIAAFATRSGWRVTIDGKPRAWKAGEDRLIQILLEPGDKTVIVTYFSL